MRLPIEQQDIFYTAEYADLCARFLYRNGQALCAVLDTGSWFVMYPFLLRDIDSLLSDKGIAPGYRDITSLYGRGGPVSDVNVPDALALFHAALKSYCLENGVICGFDRYHPVMQNDELAGPDNRVWDVGGFVVLDLQEPLIEIERKFKHSLRKNIKKAERAGVKVFAEQSIDQLEPFMCVYSSTLQRNNAREFYYVDREFYRSMSTQLEGKYKFFYATLDDQVVSCELVLFGIAQIKLIPPTM